jgi:transcriptional regulator with XRE-family HTH domain
LVLFEFFYAGTMDGTELRALLSKNIKKFRAARDFSQEKLAAQAGISTNYLSDIETGKKWPSPEIAARLASALRVSAAELFRSEEVLPPGVEALLTNYAQSSLQMVRQSLEELVGFYKKQGGGRGARV